VKSIPLPQNLLGTRYGLLLNELRHAPHAIFNPILKISRFAVKVRKRREEKRREDDRREEKRREEKRREEKRREEKRR